METSQQLSLLDSPTSTLSVEDSLASLSVSLGKEGDLTIHEVRSFLTSLESLGLKDPLYCSLRTSKVSSLMMGVEPSIPSSGRLMNWGMTSNGRCLTARTLESPKIGNGCSLSDILEENPDPKYFLSKDKAEKLGGGNKDISSALDANYWKGASRGFGGRARQHIMQLNKPKHSNDRVYGLEGLSPALNTAQGGNRQPFVAMQWRRTEKGKEFRREAQKKGKDLTPFSDGHRELVPKEGKAVGALTSQAIAKDSLLGTMEGQIRRLTPLECERLQGFPDGWTEGISDSQRYKCLGNAVTVNVISEIAKRLP